MRRCSAVIGWIWLLVALAAPTGCTSTVRVHVDRDVDVPMRDGVVLRADIYRPSGDGKFPVLVFRTPYGKHDAARSDGIHEKAVARGYAVVMQDVRGRHASDGHFNPYRQEGADGYDTIEWAAGQAWSDGRVGTYGLSYPGAVQWLAALEAPPHLVAMAPAMTFSSPRRFFYMNGIFDRSWLPWIYENIAPDARRRLGLPEDGDAEAKWQAVAGDYQSWLPLRDLPWLRREAPYYFEWLSHPPEDAWWDWAELRGRYGQVTAAVLNFSGWYDDAYGVEGAATNFNGLQQARSGQGGARTQLVLGPWAHGVPFGDRWTHGRTGFRAERRLRLRRLGARLPRPLPARDCERLLAESPGPLFRHGRQRVARRRQLAASGGSRRDALFGFNNRAPVFAV